MNRKIVYENVEPQMKVLAISELVFRGLQGLLMLLVGYGNSGNNWRV